MNRLTAAQGAALAETLDLIIAHHDALIRALPYPGTEGDVKAATNAYAPAKAALAHIEHLLKLIGAAEGDDAAIHAALAAARAEIGVAAEEDPAPDAEGRLDGFS